MRVISPCSLLEINVFNRVAFEAEPDQAINLGQTRHVAYPIVVCLELPQMSQTRQLLKSVELIVTQINPLEVEQVTEGRD